MKKLLVFSFALMSMYLVSCNKDGVEPEATDTEFLNSFSSARSASDSTKNWHNVTKIDVATLPAAITAYITATYPTATIEHAGKDTSGNYLVDILVGTTHTHLKFDSAGVFVSAKAGCGLGHGSGGNKGIITEVAVADLPAAVTTYITTTYPAATIKKAGKDANGNYVVGIQDGTTFKGLIFDATGAFKEERQKPAGKGKHGH